MRLQVRHQTAFHPAGVSGEMGGHFPEHFVGMLRLTPMVHEGLRIRFWSLCDGHGVELPAIQDGYGNTVHTISADEAEASIEVVVEGEVDTTNVWGVVRGGAEVLPPLFYLRPTPLTQPDPAIAELAQAAVQGKSVLKWLHSLMGLVAEARNGDGEGEGDAAALAHVFIIAARTLEIPARFVSGYLWKDEELFDDKALHSWAEVFVPDLGWVGFDPANQICPTEAYIRTSIGLDAEAAAPFRRVEGRREPLAGALRVRQEIAAQQQ